MEYKIHVTVEFTVQDATGPNPKGQPLEVVEGGLRLVGQSEDIGGYPAGEDKAKSAAGGERGD